MFVIQPGHGRGQAESFSEGKIGKVDLEKLC